VSFDHHKLEVYRRSLTLLDLCDRLAEGLPVGRAHLRDQIDRAACSIVGNIAEGAGEFSRKEKARFYRMVRRSGVEVAAWLEIAMRRREAQESIARQALDELEQIVGMLVRLIQSCER
jgi:four helix bundle protein